MSLRLLRGRTFTTLRAGLALNICSCLVKGLIPMRALTAGLVMAVTFINPGTTKRPGPFLPNDFFNSPERASNTNATCFRESWVAWAMLLRISPLDGDFAVAAAAAIWLHSFTERYSR